MKDNFLSISRLERTLESGAVESLEFTSGVNVLIGPPNTGKTKWLQMLDNLLGDPDSFDSVFPDYLVAKYQSIAAELNVGAAQIRIERRWKESGAKTKISVDGESMAAKDFQHILLERLGIPLLHFPKGNPLSGQTWPELSFRMLLRHIYRRQGFWGDLADKQPEGEQHACVLQFLGLAEQIYDESYGELVQLKLEAQRLKARREQYSYTLDELAKDVVSEGELSVSVSLFSLERAERKIHEELDQIVASRQSAISVARDEVVPAENSRAVVALTEERVSLVLEQANLRMKKQAAKDRAADIEQYRADLLVEKERLVRTMEAGVILADLKITHCPACDQKVESAALDEHHCNLCHRSLPDEDLSEVLGASRIIFEQNRIDAEIKEAGQLLVLLEREQKDLGGSLVTNNERLRAVDNELRPARQAVSALVSDEVAKLDVQLGALNEKQRQINRIKSAVELGEQLTRQIEGLEKRIAPLQVRVEELQRAADVEVGADRLEAGINEYLQAIVKLKPDAWRYGPVRVDLSRQGFAIKVGSKKWTNALGGTAMLYFLMGYHFGLLTLSPLLTCHYPGLAIIDLPGDFLGESIEDKENFIVQPFIDLLGHDEFSGVQVIITGASFKGLQGANRVTLNHVYAS